MNDHIELLVPVKSNSVLNACKILLWILTVALGAAGLVFGLIPMILAVGAGVGAWYVGLRVDIEYEYALTDKEIDIDVIYNKQRRKHITTLDLSKMETMFRASDGRMEGYAGRGLKKEDYSSKEEVNKSRMFAMIYDGSRMLILEPDERLLKAIRNIAPHKVNEY